ncbi:MAG: NUDIX domain-containing protein [bacterium]|nr:NUDIX domain-containing protein [bacterium]
MNLLAKLWRLLKLPKNIQLKIMRVVQDEFLVGTTGIILNNKDEVLLFKHTYRGKGKWSLPGGYMKQTEHPSEGLEREIEEESGLIVSVDEELKIRTDRDTARLDIACIGTYIGGEFRKSSEVSEARFFSFEDLPIVPQNQLFMIKEALQVKNGGVSVGDLS